MHFFIAAHFLLYLLLRTKVWFITVRLFKTVFYGLINPNFAASLLLILLSFLGMPINQSLRDSLIFLV